MRQWLQYTCLLSGPDGEGKTRIECVADIRRGNCGVRVDDMTGPYLPAGKGRLGANGAHGSSPLLHDRLPRTLIDSNHTHYVLKAMIRTCLVSVQGMGIVESTYF